MDGWMEISEDRYLKGTALTMPMGEYLVEKLPALPVAAPIKPAR